LRKTSFVVAKYYISAKVSARTPYWTARTQIKPWIKGVHN